MTQNKNTIGQIACHLSPRRAAARGGFAPRLAVCALALLAACGGGGDAAPGTTPALNSEWSGGGAPGTPGAPTASIGVTLALQGADGAAGATAIALGKPLSLSATVLDQAGKPVANALVTVAVDPDMLTTTPARGQVATDADGKATLSLAPAGVAGSGPTVVKVLAQQGGLSASAEAVVTLAQPSLSLRRVSPVASPAPLAAYASALVTLDLLNDGAVLSALPVTLSLRSDCAAAGRAVLPASVTTVQGRAQFTYQDRGCAQADSIVATVDGSGAGITVVMAPASPDAASIVLGDIVPMDKSIVIQGAGGNGRTETAQVGFRVLDKNGTPVANQPVAFSTISTRAVRLSQASGVTDGNGNVSVTLISGTEPTAVRVVARLANGLSTASDTITVTTGLPTQLSFSLSAEKFNIEGYDYDDVEDEIKLLLADQFSNPVADGVPVVAQTDSGAIGSSDRGGCVTVNGRCIVALRSQNPRYGSDAEAPRKRAGLATVSVTTLAGSDVPLHGDIAVFFSGSHVRHVSVEGAPSGVAMAGDTLTVTTAKCSAKNVALRLSDARRNPMPVDTALSFDSAVGMSGSAYPDKVPNTAPTYTNGFVTGDQGTVHTLALLPDAASCQENGPKAMSASANLVVTTPFGNTTLVPIVIRYQGKADAP